MRSNLCPTFLLPQCVRSSSPLLSCSGSLSQARGCGAHHRGVFCFDIGGPERSPNWLYRQFRNSKLFFAQWSNSPVFVKEKKIPAKGTISKSVATVPKLPTYFQHKIFHKLARSGCEAQLTLNMPRYAPQASEISERKTTSSVGSTVMPVNF